MFAAPFSLGSPMKLRRLVAGAGLGCVLLIPAAAAAVQTRGVPSCADWTKASRTAALYYRSWLVGYLSGMAQGTGAEFWGRPDAPNRLSNEAVFQWIDNYCRAQPLKDVDDGAAELFRERRKPAGKP